jgi:hypothetical protein
MVAEKYQRNFRVPSGLCPANAVLSRAMKKRSIKPYPSPQRSEKRADGEATLPPWRAFLVQLTSDTTADGATYAGRVEHLGSGKREPFASGEELLVMLLGLLEKAEHEEHGA